MTRNRNIACTTARWELSRILERVQHHGEHVTLTRHNIPVAVILPIRDAEKLEKEKCSPVRDNSKDAN